MDYSIIYKDENEKYSAVFVSPIKYGGFTLLMRLCHNEIMEVPIEEIEKYLEANPHEINKKHDGDDAVLSYIILNKDLNRESIKLIKILLKKGADPNINIVLDRAITRATNRYGLQFKLIKLLLKHGADPNLISSFFGWTPLMYLITTKMELSLKLKLMELLLENGADPDRCDNETMRPSLMICMLLPTDTYTKLKITKILLKYGADPSIQDCNGYTALMQLLSSCDTEQKSKIIKVLLRKGTNPNLQNDDGETALMITIMNNNDPEIVSLLLEYGANHLVRNKNNISALQIAHTRGNKNAIKFIRKRSLGKLLAKNQELYQKNILLRKILDEVPEGKDILNYSSELFQKA
jgi:ankyrin repeat protein